MWYGSILKNFGFRHEFNRDGNGKYNAIFLNQPSLTISLVLHISFIIFSSTTLYSILKNFGFRHEFNRDGNGKYNT